MRHVLALVALFAVLAGCATPPPQLSRADYLAMSSRTLEAPREQVLEAAEKVLRLADGDDFKIHHHATGFNAQRAWSVYLVLAAAMGTDFWVVKTSETGGKTRLEIEVGRQESAIMPMMTTTPGTWSAGTMPASATPINGPALYELFFARIDYLLGTRPDWPTCEWSDARVSSKATWGANDALCSAFNITDTKPEGPLVAEKASSSK